MVVERSAATQSNVEAAAEVFQALSNPLRVRLLMELGQPVGVSRLVELTGSTQPLVSQHLRVLRSARLVTVTRSGREALYQISDEHIRHVVQDAVAHAGEAFR